MAVLEEPGLPGIMCPMCHTTHPGLADQALAVGGYWQCARCGQHWDNARLAAVAAYAEWVLEHDARRTPKTDTTTSL
jgi:RNA polymerase-binding transcription factor DksA